MNRHVAAEHLVNPSQDPDAKHAVFNQVIFLFSINLQLILVCNALFNSYYVVARLLNLNHTFPGCKFKLDLAKFFIVMKVRITATNFLATFLATELY